MIKIKPDREGLLTQWDLNRRIQITGLEDISNTEIHFSKPDDTKGAYVVLPVIENGIAFADIPNILLTVSGRIDVCVYRDDHTCVRGVFVVAPREKPDDYVYTETEVWRYEKLVEQLNGKEDTANRVTTVDDSSDDKHYPTAKAVYKAIPKSLKNPYSLTFTGAVTGSYDGSKPMTFNIPSGGSGTDISLGLTGAAVGDIIKVKSVDDSGKPTAWEAAGLPGGSGKAKSQILIDQEITELTASLSVTLEHDFHNLTAIIYCGHDGVALTADSDGTAVASKIALLIDTTAFGFNALKVSQTDTSTATWQTRMICAEWSDDLSVFKRGLAVEITTGSSKTYGLHFGGAFAMYGTLGTDDNSPRTGKTANIVVNGAYLNVGTRVVLWGEYYE